MDITRHNLKGGIYQCVAAQSLPAIIYALGLSCLSSMLFAETMEYRYWNGTSGRNHYELNLLELALRKTAASYPPYSIVERNEDIVSSRARREIQRGELINIFTAPVFLDPAANTEGIISVRIPILKGLLGYRRIIIRAEDKALFASISSEEKLRDLRVGQGRDWQDNIVYRANAFELVDNGEFDQLAPMLSQHRFDYIPLGIAEIESIYAEIGGEEKNMIIDPSILIYYPLPVFFHVSAKYPKLAERVEKGLSMAVEDGSLDSLFRKKFSPIVSELNSRERRLFVLKNPYLPAEYRLEEPSLLNERSVRQ